MIKSIPNFVNNSWKESQANDSFDVLNPATGELIFKTPFSNRNEVDEAVIVAEKAFHEWKSIPVLNRIQPFFKLKTLLEENLDSLAETITIENGKTLSEARGELQRAIENVEVACGTPMLMQGDISENVAMGIDEFMIRQPLGVCAIVAPFNFPGMIPFWFLPYAVATGNTVVIKPSERTPLTMKKIGELFQLAGFPNGVINIINGSVDTVNSIIDHPLVKAISFVGSTHTAKQIYQKGALHGKRVQAQGGAKNPLIIMPDADVEMTTKIVADSTFGNAGQRCLAASLIITVGNAKKIFTPALQEVAETRIVGNGLDNSIEMGPVISQESKHRIKGLIQEGINEGADLLVDGRHVSGKELEKGFYLRPTILNNVPPEGQIFKTEIFGPVMGLLHVPTLDDAIKMINKGNYGNMACIFTSSGESARRFRNEAIAGNIGVNIGVAAPMAFFPFSGWKDSFFGTLHGQGKHAVEFFTQTKVVVERWPREWSRKF